jgi:hypothetical protein
VCGTFAEENWTYCYACGLCFRVCDWEVKFAHIV